MQQKGPNMHNENKHAERSLILNNVKDRQEPTPGDGLTNKRTQ